MRTRDVLTGLIILVILIVAVLWIRSTRNKKLSTIPSPTPTISQKVNKAFPSLNIPAGTEKVELKDVSGGQAFGVATKTEIVVNLPDLAKGQAYQGYLQNSQGKMALLGTFRLSKSGWLLEYNSGSYPGYNKIVVMFGQKRILEGSF